MFLFKRSASTINAMKTGPSKKLTTHMAADETNHGSMHRHGGECCKHTLSTIGKKTWWSACTTDCVRAGIYWWPNVTIEHKNWRCSIGPRNTWKQTTEMYLVHFSYDHSVIWQFYTCMHALDIFSMVRFGLRLYPFYICNFIQSIDAAKWAKYISKRSIITYYISKRSKLLTHLAKSILK